MTDQSDSTHRRKSRDAHNEEFVKRLWHRKPELRQRYNAAIERARATMPAREAPPAGLEVEGAPSRSAHELALETIVRDERPVLFVKDDWLDTVDVTLDGPEAQELIDDLQARRAVLQPLMPLIGRVDVTGFPGNDFLGTGWFVDTDIVVTNRHVAGLIARRDGRRFVFSRGVAGRPITAAVCTAHEFDDLDPDAARTFAVKEVLYIEPESSAVDIAFLKVERRTDGSRLDRIAIAGTDVGDNVKVVVIGYPARAPRSVIPDQELMKRLYRDKYDVKRAAPGLTMSEQDGASRHDCTTLGGNSGSLVANLQTGEAVGLHFAGLYQESNFAVRATVLTDYVRRKVWNAPPAIETAKPAARPAARPQAAMPQAATPATPGGAVTVTIPLSITVSLGQPVALAALVVSAGTAAAAGSGAADPAAAEAAAKAFWDQRPDGVVAVRVGFPDEGGQFGDTPYLAASVPPDRLAAVAAGAPAEFAGFAVRYLPANAAEQLDAWPITESVESIDYDDDARTGKGFSFEAVSEPMTVRAHVGPEYSWDELDAFLKGAQRSLVSAIYEFHAPQIKDAIAARLDAGASLRLVMDNASFSAVKDEEFDRAAVFEEWKGKYKQRFERIVAPEGVSGLISDSYHIKVTVREDDTFWLSSGNWKKQSSQPVITQQQRDDATETDLPGNREWHVVIRNKTLADRFRNHIQQDFKRSADLGGGPLPKRREALEIEVDVPIAEAVVLEKRRPPSRLVEPKEFNGAIKVKPLLTPDKEGAVYSEAVLELIRSARKSLLFQIPYIGMPSAPNVDRGYIDALIKALTEKLKMLDDARVILRVGGSRYSDPTHAAWYFKSKGVDIAERLRQIDNHHTKGMIVDGKRLLLGSHNWSKPGVTLNRDASLLFDDAGIAGYYAQAFEIDWARASPIRPKRFVKTEAVVQEAAGDRPPPGYRRVLLSDLLKEEE